MDKRRKTYKSQRMMQVSHENTPECLSQNSLHSSHIFPERHIYSWLINDRYRGENSGLENNNTCGPAGSRARQDIIFIDITMNYEEPISVLVNWLKSIGWEVQWYTTRNMVDAASLDEKAVTVSKKQIPRHQYYTLLHECAHVDLLAGPVENRRGEPYGYIDLWWGKVDERTLRHRVAVVIDEISAWEHGIKLAHRLGISVDLVKYRDFRNRNLKSYFNWALEKDDLEDLTGDE